MRAEYLINIIEEYCEQKNLDISGFYKELAKRYQQEWGVNIDKQMHDNGKYDIPFYLEEIGIVERYISIINRIKKENI